MSTETVTSYSRSVSEVSHTLSEDNHETTDQSTREFSADKSVVITDGDGVLIDDLLGFLKPKFEEFDLKTLLVTSPHGKNIMSYYNKNNKLDNTRRNRLCSIIIKHLYNYIVKK